VAIIAPICWSPPSGPLFRRMTSSAGQASCTRPPVVPVATILKLESAFW